MQSRNGRVRIALHHLQLYVSTPSHALFFFFLPTCSTFFFFFFAGSLAQQKKTFLCCIVPCGILIYRVGYLSTVWDTYLLLQIIPRSPSHLYCGDVPFDFFAFAPRYLTCLIPQALCDDEGVRWCDEEVRWYDEEVRRHWQVPHVLPLP